jgi:prevent-host-death family protein
MTTVTTTDFQRNPGPYQEAALREPVTITGAGQERLVLLSAEEYHRLKNIETISAGWQNPESSAMTSLRRPSGGCTPGLKPTG